MKLTKCQQEIVDLLKANPLAWVGVEWGGYVVLCAGGKHQERLAALRVEDRTLT